MQQSILICVLYALIHNRRMCKLDHSNIKIDFLTMFRNYVLMFILVINKYK